MPRTCTICLHPEIEGINAAIIAKEPLRIIARRFATSGASIFRHKRDHLPVLLTKATEAAEVVQANDLLASVRALHERTLAILEKAEAAGKLETALKAIKEARSNLELLAKLDGQLREREPGEVHITVNYVDRPLIAVNRAPQASASVQLPAAAG